MKRPEQEIQKAVVAHLRQRGKPRLVYFHVPNGVRGNRRKDHIQGAIAKGMGVRPGVSDLILLFEGNAYALELKAEGGRATEAQMEFMDEWQAAGGFGVVAEGLDRAIKCLEAWGMLRGIVA